MPKSAREAFLEKKRIDEINRRALMSDEQKAACLLARRIEYQSRPPMTEEQRKRKNEINKAYMARTARANGVPKRPDAKLWKKANPDKVRANSRRSLLKNKYGITEADYVAMMEAQQHKCAICGTTNPTGRNGKWHIDHCHKTGIVRGLLCGPCNQALGLFRDDPARIMTAFSYLMGVQSSSL